MNFKFPDRLTKTEAAAINQWALTQPQVVAAFRSKTGRDHESVKLFADLVSHFAYHHPETAAGEPEPWPGRAPTGRVKSEADPYADFHPEDAEALLSWAKTTAQYDAYFDRNHPQHQHQVEHTAKLMAIIHPEGAGEDRSGQGDNSVSPRQGPPAGASSPEIDALRKDPAYLDRRHPEHAAAVAAVTAAYEKAYPAQAREAHGMGEIARRPLPALAPVRIAELQRDPAYLNKAHPEHAAKVDAMASAYRAAFPDDARREGEV